jgi:Protein of unknown function (DUF3047)
MRKILLGLFCGLIAAAALAQQPPALPRFSTMQPGGPPADWKPLQLASYKNNVDYRLVMEDGTVVVKATSHNAASYLAVATDFDPRKFPLLSWRWKVVQGIPTANTAEQSKEDSPARVMVSFAGDVSKLSFKDRFAASAAQTISGQPLPYATLMYVWGEKVPVGSITVSSRSARIRMLAVAADEQGIGKWQSYTRNLVEDYKRVFNEEPNHVTSIELMTDTDNTGADAEAYYGDITAGPAK